MSDISKCEGKDCPAKEKCYLFTAPVNDIYQSYLMEVPFVIDRGKFECDHFWGQPEDLLLIQMKLLTQ